MRDTDRECSKASPQGYKSLATSCASYAAAAGAVGLSAVAQPATAAVVYSNPADVSTAFVTNSASSTNVYFDLDGGTAANAPFAGADYLLNYTNDSVEKPELAALASTNALGSVQLAKGGTANDYAVKFGANSSVGGAHPTWTANGWLENGNNNDGLWTSNGEGFLGLRVDFANSGLFNYGWARVNYDDDAGTLTLLDFAYEIEPGVAIVTPGAVPEPHSMALAAVGAVGLSALRRRRLRR